ncbi:RNA-binding protein 25-like [Homalodisca vitripennis]|uniref:RNA-binding protein 25-like n=1 Tax=Homalodisca vitripennis TaxID=197043 RepID=UPI001EEB4E64|nr:RNA-binding protein 25-like [Homalodisca vitripennis]
MLEVHEYGINSVSLPTCSSILTPSGRCVCCSNERAQRSRMHERGTSAERRYKRSHRRSPTSSNHRRHHTSAAKYRERERERDREREQEQRDRDRERERERHHHKRREAEAARRRSYSSSQVSTPLVH